jgi:hypothetical protein
MRDVIRQGCDLEADVVPIVARELPELPRPLKNWGAPWLVREILAARDQRLAGHRVEAIDAEDRARMLEQAQAYRKLADERAVRLKTVAGVGAD